jgi:hypothetical protein
VDPARGQGAAAGGSRQSLRAVIIDDASLWTVRWDLVILLAVSGVFVVMAWRCCSWE